jgi:oxygen-dependent protoporphyrinogen oxidase
VIKVVVVGGGVSGLGAAYKLRRAAEEGHEVEFVVLERDARLGGKIKGENPDGYVIDGGPDCFLTQKPAVHRVARSLGITDRLLPSDESRKRTWILAGGRLHELPDGVMMMVPTKFWSFVTTGLFTWPGKLRMAMDLFLPKKAPGDETLASFVKRRLGKQCLDRLAEPLVGGVHASDPDTMSLEATFPRFLEMEQQHGSLIKGFVAARLKMERMKREARRKGRERTSTFFTSFKGGMHELIDAMADAVGHERIRTDAPVGSIEPVGDGWRVVLEDGEALDADAVIVATEGWAAAELIGPIEPALGDVLGEIPHTSSATVSLAFEEAEVGIDLEAFGVLCPQAEGRSIMAATYSSTKWPGRARKGHVLFRGFVGGPHNQEVLDYSDEALVEIVLSELRAILGLKGDPVLKRVFRWERGMPQYTLGHLDRVAAVDDWVAKTPGIAVAGGAYRGVGIPNCIESGEAAATKVLADAGVSLAEDQNPGEARPGGR